MIDHHLNRLVGGQEAVFDAVDPGTDAGPDRGVADGVRGHSYPGAVGFVGDRGELRVGILLGARGGAVRHDSAGRRHLDQLGAVANLVADTGDHVGHTVGDALGDRQRHDPGRESLEHRRVQVPAVGGDGVTRGIDARAGVPALVDGALQRDVEQVAAGLDHQPEVAHGGEPGIQRGARVHRTAQCAIGGVVLNAVHRRRQALGPTGAADEQVELHVHQARQQRDVPEVDDRGRIRQWPFGIDRGDALPVDHHHRR